MEKLTIVDTESHFHQTNQLQFRIISTWGSVSQAGLTELQIFNEDGEKIELKPSEFHLRNCGLSSIKNINKITDSVIYTTEEEHMWLCSMPAPPTTPEIYLNINSAKGIGAIRIWNYNKSLIESTKGIKELEIIHNKNIVWCGIVNRGPGNEYEAYHMEICLKKDINLPKIEMPTTFIDLQPATSPTQNDESVPIWLKDSIKTDSKFSASNKANISSSTHLGRRDSEKSNLSLNAGRNAESFKSIPEKAKESKPDTSTSRRQLISDYSDNNQTTDTSKVSDGNNKSMSRLRNALKAEPSVKDIFDDGGITKNEKIPESQKENVQSGKKDDNLSINTVEYFNLTNFGRLKPAKRESLIQVYNLQQDVLEKVKDVQKRLDFKTTPVVEGSDILTQFDKGLKEDQPKLKIPQQSIEQASINIGKRKEAQHKKESSLKTSITMYFIRIILKCF